MTFENDGYLVTDARQDPNLTWETQTDWEAYQEAGDIQIENGTVKLGTAIPDSGISRWTFDDADTNSGTAKDVWGSNDGTIYGATTGASGKYNEGYDFGGNDDRVDDTGANTSDGRSFTIAIWWNPDNDGNSHIVASEGNTWWIGNRFDNDEVNFNVKDSGSTQQNIRRSGAATAGFFHLFGLSFDGSGTLTGRLNDSFKDTLSGISTPLDRSGGYDIQFSGLKGSGNEANGVGDDPRYYDKVLSDTEWSNLYNNGSI